MDAERPDIGKGSPHIGSTVRDRESLPESGQGWADRFRALLNRYGRNGRPWTLRAIQHASGGKVSEQYLSEFQSGGYARPGIDKLKAISDALNAPFSLWFIPPAQWEEYLARDAAASISNLCGKLEPEDAQTIVYLLERLVSAGSLARD